MPCRSDHMEPNSKEIAMSRVLCVLAELNNKRPQKSWWEGYHPTAYCGNLSDEECNTLTASACEKMGKLNASDLGQLSLEAQMWWRDHKRADQQRSVAAKESKRQERLRAQALAKLTATERKALGL